MAETLSELQMWMHSALLHPHATREQDTAARLVPNPRLSASDALAIYQRSYSLRIASCMREQFPALCHALGEGLFNDFVADYVRDAPPESYTLYDLGRRFSGFLEANRPDRDQSVKESWIDFIVDMARFERSVFTTFDCPGAEELTLATIDTPDHRLIAQPSLSIGQYQFPVAWYYHQVREKNAPQPQLGQETYVAIVRKEYQTVTAMVSRPHYEFLSAICTGQSVDQALSATAESMGSDMSRVIEAWRDPDGIRTQWINAGFFIQDADIRAET
ncbi:MAG: DNA-binding domain-containing protein [Sulfitobacter sp.]